MNSLGSKLQNLLTRVLQSLCILFFVLTFWNGLSFFSEKYGFDFTNSVVFIGLISFLILMGFLLSKNISNKVYLFVLILLTLSVRIIWVLKVDTPIISDFGMMYHSAVKAAAGDFSFSESGYFQTWVYQLGFTMYQAFVIKIFGESIFVLKLLNVLYSMGTTILVYKITSKLFNEHTGRIAGLVYAMFIPSIVMSSVLTNQHLATFLFYLSFYLLLQYNQSKKYIWLAAGILIGFGDIIRPLGSFILLAVGIFLFITQFLGTTRKEKVSTVKKFAGIIIVYYLVHLLISQLFITMDVTKHPLSNRDPLWKFVLGFNLETSGQYSGTDAKFVWQYPVGSDERHDAEVELIKERIADKQKVFELFEEKLKLMWAENDLSIFWSAKHFSNLEMIKWLYQVENLMYISMMLFGIVSLITLIRDKQLNKRSSLFLLLILGYVAVHLLIEIQTRYRFFIIPSFVIIQSFGIYTICTLINKRFKLVNKKESSNA